MRCWTRSAYLVIQHRRWGAELEYDRDGGYWELRLIGRRGFRTFTFRRHHRDHDREEEMLSA